MDSRWACGPLAVGKREGRRNEDCELGIDLNYFRYVRHIQVGEPLVPRNFVSESCRGILTLAKHRSQW